MNDPKGSVWRKWDLHIHTPYSIVQYYGGVAAWDKYIDALSKLPEDIKVIGINDYIFLDGYKKVVAAKAEGKLPNIDLVLPVIELRLDKFGGTKNDLSRVNYHVIFSNEITAEQIESQFLSALCPKYTLTPEYDDLRTSGKWMAVPTRESLADLGRLIIDSVPDERKVEFDAPLVEGFNNLCLSLSDIQDVLQSHYFVGKTLTAVGKTEWANIKWNDHAIADKKTIINGTDLVFISSNTAAEWAKSQKSLTDNRVNDRLLDCSDAHYYADATEKDRLAKCFTWIKADPTFEGLRQAVFEYPSRVHVSDTPPLEPFLQIKKAKLKFPKDAKLTNLTKENPRPDLFCFRGEREIVFSPYLTCVIGGRGTGKSTLLNIIHEKLEGGTQFFKDNRLEPDKAAVSNCVTIEGVAERGVVEFLQQNEIEQFASDHERLTAAIFTRLRKLDTKNLLQKQEGVVDAAVAATRAQLERLKSHQELSLKLSNSKKELVTQQGIVQSFESPDYKRVSGELTMLNKELQQLKTSKTRLDNLVQSLKVLLSQLPAYEATQKLNPYDEQVRVLVQAIDEAIAKASTHPSLAEAIIHQQQITGKVKDLREELDKFLKSRKVSEENLADVGKATERIAQLEEDIAGLEKKVGTLETELSQFTPQIDEAEKYEKVVRELLAPVNVDLKVQGNEVKPIELQYDFDLNSFRDEMIKYICTAIGPVKEREARDDFVNTKLKEINFAAITDCANALKLIPEEDGVYVKMLREFFANAVNLERVKLEAELRLLDVQKLGRIHVLYDGKPVENSSFGQRCTAVIVVLLLLGNMPIVIDEPEAHLDSSLIAKYLVGLIKKQKKHRQIIFATHNANLVINGDAELVHCMSMDAKKVTEIVSTTIENLTHRDHLLALEGGLEAFHQREKRYGHRLNVKASTSTSTGQK